MRKPGSTRATVMLTLESLFWILVSLYVRHLLDLAAIRWNILPIWLVLLKIGVVLGLIAAAVQVHRLLVRGLAPQGWFPPEEKK